LLEAFRAPGQWLKGNLHTHTTNSDGRVTPEERVAGYAQRGYDFIAFTDHNLVTRCSSDDLAIITGAEYVVPLDRRNYHLVALNLPIGFRLFEGLAIQESIDEVLSVGGVPFLAHPYWCGLSLADLRNVRGPIGIEVFNTGCHVEMNKGISSVHWEDLLAAGWRGFGFAVDDCHFLSDAYQGWIMAKAAGRDAGSILDAIKAGRFYASTGPEIKSVELAGSRLIVRCSDAAAITFFCRAHSGQCLSAPPGEVLNGAEFTVAKEQGYVRIEVTDKQGHAAWTNPLYLA